jgi:uncharacterized protein YjbI with pentapeptide repeats
MRQPIAAAVLILSLSAASLAQEAPPPATPAAALKPISRAEIAEAVANGDLIAGRSILGEDLAAVLTGSIGSHGPCNDRAGLNVERSSIKGDVLVESKGTKGEDNEPDDSAVKQASPDPTGWLSIPIVIRASAISGRLDLAQLGISCRLDLSGSSLANTLNIRFATFESDVIAEGGVFKNDMSAYATTWRKSVNFRRAQFMGSVNFSPLSQQSTTFHGDVDFQEAVFHRSANFFSSEFLGRSNFRSAQFMKEAQFSDTSIGPGPIRSFDGPFYMAEFVGQGIFRSARFKSLRFNKTTFRNGVDFHGVPGGTLRLWSVTIIGDANFDDAHLDLLEVIGISPSVTVDGDAIFRRASIGRLFFNRVAFKKVVDFGQARLKSNFCLSAVLFGGDAYFEDTEFPSPHEEGDKPSRCSPSFHVKDVTMNKGLYIEAQQFLVRSPWWAIWREDTSRFDSDDPNADRRFWRGLQRAFQAAGNVELKNYSEYRVRYLSEGDPAQTQLTSITSVLSRWFWGYGLRPIRVLVWFGLFLIAFAGVYLSQLPRSGYGLRQRLKYSLIFSLRTAWEFKFGYEHSQTDTFRVITAVQSISAKLLIACFVYSLTQASPLLSDLMKKLLP